MVNMVTMNTRYTSRINVAKLFLLVAILVFLWTCYSQQELPANEFFIILRRKIFNGRPHRLVGKECSNSTDHRTCLSIVDRIAKSDNGSYFVIRFLVNGTKGNDVLIDAVKLKTPQIRNERTMETKWWEVDSRLDENMPRNIMFESMLLFGDFELSKNMSGVVVEVGVGSGSTITFLAELLPNVTITGVDNNTLIEYLPSKWFGHKNSLKNQISIMEPFRYLKQFQNNGQNVDAILSNECLTYKPDNDFICPTKRHRSSDYLNTASAIIGTKGVFVANVLLIPNDSKQLDDLLYLHLKYFKNCIMNNGHEFLNKILICKNNEQAARNQTEVEMFSKSLGVHGFMAEVLHNRIS